MERLFSARKVARFSAPLEQCIRRRCPDRGHLTGIETDYLAKLYRPDQVTVSSISRHR
jgi:hypothetical protein